ncbi:hypothetical protein [Chitinophaga ginsengisoli]|nr:hypothetical protein [Chitinophaga ginsengisoli]
MCRSHVGWRQYNIFAARLGFTKEATAPDHHVNYGGMWFVPPFTFFLN